MSKRDTHLSVSQQVIVRAERSKREQKGQSANENVKPCAEK